jgi:hypothetical protein
MMDDQNQSFIFSHEVTQRNTKKKGLFKPSQLKVFGSPETFFQKGFWPPEAKVIVN